MTVFRDMSFCASDCVNDACPRHFGEDDEAAARKWWNDKGNPPVAFIDFSAKCDEYWPLPPTVQQQENKND